LPEVLIVAALLWPPTNAVAGSPHAATAAAPAPVAETQTPAASAPPLATAQNPPITTTPPTQRPQPAARAQPPGTVRLPSGAVAYLVRQEVTDGALPVPKNLNEAAWWGAALDAQRGASVFAGHVNWGGRTGPFAELWNTQINQQLTTVAPDGRPSVYRISQLITLHKDELPQRAADLFSQTGSHRLVLITCGGEWIGGTQGYAENRVAIADPN
jgi:hypothetical protein